MAQTAKVLPFRPRDPAPETTPDEQTFFAQQMARHYPDDSYPKEGEYIGGHDWDWKQK